MVASFVNNNLWNITEDKILNTQNIIALRKKNVNDSVSDNHVSVKVTGSQPSFSHCYNKHSLQSTEK